MPPRPVPIRFIVRLDVPAIATAAAAAQARLSPGPWRTAIGKAVAHASAHPRLISISNGVLSVRSPRSGRIYAVSRERCTCEARGACWHRALVRLVLSVWEQARPCYRCAYCGGPMAPARTIAHERCYACLACGHEVMVGATDTLAVWATETARAA